jgi:hypothetical protein
MDTPTTQSSFPSRLSLFLETRKPINKQAKNLQNAILLPIYATWLGILFT